MDKEVGKFEPPVLEIMEVVDSIETSQEVAALETGTAETAEELTAEKRGDNTGEQWIKKWGWLNSLS